MEINFIVRDLNQNKAHQTLKMRKGINVTSEIKVQIGPFTEIVKVSHTLYSTFVLLKSIIRRQHRIKRFQMISNIFGENLLFHPATPGTTCVCVT